MGFKFLDLISPVVKIGSIVLKTNPVGAGVLTALEVISEAQDASDEERAEMYMAAAAGFLDVSAEIIRSLKDGKISAEEHARIIADVQAAMEALTD